MSNQTNQGFMGPEMDAVMARDRLEGDARRAEQKRLDREGKEGLKEQQAAWDKNLNPKIVPPRAIPIRRRPKGYTTGF
jgi:hypothetical protein